MLINIEVYPKLSANLNYLTPLSPITVSMSTVIIAKHFVFCLNLPSRNKLFTSSFTVECGWPVDAHTHCYTEQLLL